MNDESKDRVRPRIGLALSGGAARGIAHVGVLRALEESNIPIDAIAGAVVLAVLREEFPAVAVTGEMIEREVGRDGLQPAAGGRAGRQHVEVLVGFQEDLLGNILRLRVVAGEARGRGEDHILVVAHERGEVDRGDQARGWCLHWSVIVHAQNTARAGKSQESYWCSSSLGASA